MLARGGVVGGSSAGATILTAETHGGTTWLTAYGAEGGKRDAFVQLPDRHAVVIVLTTDDAADAKGSATRIAERQVGTDGRR